MTLSGATNPSESGPRSDGNKGVLYLLRISLLLKSLYQIIKFHIQDPHWGSLTPVQSCFILLP